MRTAALASLAGSLACLGLVPGAFAAPTIVGTIPFTGAEPLEVAVYEAQNKVFVTEDNGGKLYIFDGATHATLGVIDIGGSAYDLVVNETYGKVYVASDKDCCTTGANPGNGLISIVDAKTNQLIKQFNPGYQGNVSYFALGTDDAAGKVFYTYFSGVGVIDAATDQVTDLTPAEPLSPWAPTKIVVNDTTHTAFIDDYGHNRFVTIDGATNAVGFLELGPSGAFGPLDFELNERENKLYATMNRVPGQGEIGILIHDRDTGTFKFVGREDLEPLGFNEATNRLFSGVQVGQRGGIVDGATDLLTMLDNLDDKGGYNGIDIRSSTDNAYIASSEITSVVSGQHRCVVNFTTAPDLGGGLVATSVAVNQTTGRVYVNNRHQAGKITVFQDDGPACVPAPPPPDTVELKLRARDPQHPLDFEAVVIVVECPAEPCGVAAKGSVRVPAVVRGAAARRLKLRGTTELLDAGQPTELRLELTNKIRRRLKAAFAHRRTRRKPNASVSVTAADAARNTITKTASIRLRR